MIHPMLGEAWLAMGANRLRTALTMLGMVIGVGAVVIMMADESDDCRDVVRYWQELNKGVDCVFGSRFIHGGGVIDYPTIKYVLNRLTNFFIRWLFRIRVSTGDETVLTRGWGK